ncbi:DUF1934 domain-containing protein [Leptotrichia sp. OH3620_COT-345]|uniref:DUF1934 family protein n=1 Tax=Leptotrichia sp. OH3620_COT-345 TaxID=2491048 RepID=UPI000F6551D2|nr:DUF1934 family protein [Leptotrichia sp. OH3620_COT-345]RRD38762.1 DUF1934 domain-containing protein [Leptotrichia sp. OH3620_COT-345]
MEIKIKSSDIHGQNYEKKFKLKKILDQENGKEYVYDDEYGKCKILKFTDSVEIYRYGQINSKQMFRLNKKTPFVYFIPELKSKYEIFTRDIVIEIGRIYIEYDIINKNELLNSIKLEITEFGK